MSDSKPPPAAPNAPQNSSPPPAAAPPGVPTATQPGPPPASPRIAAAPVAGRTPPAARHVLFVCTGNTCRSPMGEFLLRHALKGRAEPLASLAVRSAGIFANDGASSGETALHAMWAVGIDMGRHRSQSITRALAENALAIFVMERNHERAMRKLFPALRVPLHLLREFAPRHLRAGATDAAAQSPASSASFASSASVPAPLPPFSPTSSAPSALFPAPASAPAPFVPDLPDPHGGGLREYQDCRDNIVETLPGILAYLEQLLAHPTK